MIQQQRERFWTRAVAPTVARAVRLGLLALAAAASATGPVRAGEKVIVVGILDGEMWKTDPGSVLLQRNAGHPAPAETLKLWQVFEIHPTLHLFAQEDLRRETPESGEAETEHEIPQAYLRYSPAGPTRLEVQAGKMVSPVGSFARRYLPDLNPLVGEPDGYSFEYNSYAIQLTGAVSRFDYRASVMDQPLVNTKYTLEPDRTMRPAFGAGVTPVTGLRLGAYFTRGPYLNHEVTPLLPSGARWKDFDEQVLGFETQFSRGHFELNGEFALSGYEVPGRDQVLHGKAWYGEVKHTWTPRFFTAIRIEQNDYAFVRPVSPLFWLGLAVNFYDAEAGVGYRLGPGTLLKVSYRRDHWSVDESLKPILPNGYAVAFQISQRFDVRSLFDRRQ